MLSMRNRKIVLLILISLVIAMTFVIANWPRQIVEHVVPLPQIPEDVLFSMPMPQSVVEFDAEKTPSTVAIRIALPIDKLKAQAETITPVNFRGDGNGPDQCASILGVKKCVGTRYHYDVNREEIQITPTLNNTLHLAIPLTITGTGGLSGKAAEYLNLDAKKFQAKVQAKADLAMTLGADWCPKITVKPSFEWIERAKVEVFSNVWMDIADTVETAFRGQLDQMSAEFAKAVRCDEVRKEINRIWTYRSLPVQTVDNVHFINLEPRRLGYSGMDITSGAVNLYLMLTFNAGISNYPIQRVALAPPAMSSDKFVPGAIRLNVPFFYYYEELKDKITERLLGREFVVNNPNNTINAKVSQVELYPSDKRLVFSALVTVESNNESDPVTGWLYWTAMPQIRADGTGVKLTSIAMTPPSDTRRWQNIAAVFDKELHPLLTHNELDELGLPAANSNAAIAETLSKMQNGISVNIVMPTLHLQRVLPMNDRFFVEGVFYSTAGIDYSAI